MDIDWLHHSMLRWAWYFNNRYGFMVPRIHCLVLHHFYQYIYHHYAFYKHDSRLGQQQFQLSIFREISRTLSIFHAWWLLVCMTTWTMHHMFLDTLIELWLFNRIWYLSWYDTINIYRRWILAPSIQKQQDTSMWQTSFLEFDCVNICNWKMDRLITSIHAMISLTLRTLGMDN